MKTPLAAIRILAEKAQAHFIALKSKERRTIVSPGSYFDEKGFDSAEIFGNILHKKGRYHYFADGSYAGNVPDEIKIKPIRSRFPVTRRKNLEFFCSEEYREATMVSPVYFDKVCSYQKLDLAADKRTGSILFHVISWNDKNRMDKRTADIVSLVTYLTSQGDAFICEADADALNTNAKRALIDSIYEINKYNLHTPVL